MTEANVLTEQESQLLTGMVSLATVFVQVLEKEVPDLRRRVEGAAGVEFHRLLETDKKTAATALALFLQAIQPAHQV